MSEAYQWVNRYSTPLSTGAVISSARPGEQIAKCISEIQDVIDSILGASEEDKPSELEKRVASLALAVANLAGKTSVIAESGAGVYDIRYDSGSMQLQKKTSVNGPWVMIEGGQAQGCT